MKGLICRFFHRIYTLDNCYFKENCSKKCVKLFYCEKCNLKYMAYEKRAVLRVKSKL